jgi:hypothetical protein
VVDFQAPADSGGDGAQVAFVGADDEVVAAEGGSRTPYRVRKAAGGGLPDARLTGGAR